MNAQIKLSRTGVFSVAMAMGATATVIAGFAPSFYLRSILHVNQPPTARPIPDTERSRGAVPVSYMSFRWTSGPARIRLPSLLHCFELEGLPKSQIAKERL